MGVRFRRRIKIGKGVNLNISKSGVGISGGVRGLRAGAGPKGAYRSMGIPGTGLYMFDYAKKGKKTPLANTAVGGAAKGDSETTDTASLVPPELAVSSLPVVGIILSVVLMIFYLPLGLLSLAASGYFFHRQRESDRYKSFTSFQKGLEEAKEGDQQGALAKFLHADRLFPGVPRTQRYIAQLFHLEGAYEKALPYYEQYLSQEKEDWEAKLEYARNLASDGKHEDSIRKLQNLPDEIKELPVVYNTIAAIFIDMENNEEAAQLLTSKVGRKRKMNEDLMLSRYLQGTAYKNLDDKKRALRELRKVYAEDMDYLDTAKMIEELEAESKK